MANAKFPIMRSGEGRIATINVTDLPTDVTVDEATITVQTAGITLVGDLEITGAQILQFIQVSGSLKDGDYPAVISLTLSNDETPIRDVFIRVRGRVPD